MVIIAIYGHWAEFGKHIESQGRHSSPVLLPSKNNDSIFIYFLSVFFFVNNHNLVSHFIVIGTFNLPSVSEII